jgi:hypothetical protein
MDKIRSRSVILSLAILIAGTVAHAQATRTWVSGVGDDANPCSRTAPCKTFAGAISKTADQGEISVLDPGGFGAVTVTKGITINGEGTLAGILNAATNGVIVNITSTPRTVMLHNISINGAGSGFDGIRNVSTVQSTLIVDHCWIYGQNGNGTNSDGIEVNTAANSNLKVSRTLIENVSGDCIRANTSAGQVLAMVDDSHLQDCNNGFDAVARVRAGINRSVITHGAGTGVGTTGTDSQVNIDEVFLSFWATALKSNNAGTASHIGVSDSIISMNTTGINTSLGGSVDSFQGNSLIGNTTPGAFSSTTAKQ